MLNRKALVPTLFFALVLLAVGCGPEETPAEATPIGLQPDVARNAKEKLSQVTGAGVEAIEIVRANQVEWTDTCLELGGEDEFCGQALTPGWSLIMDAGGQEYEVHTDLDGETVRVKR
jgi:hypothetical protein